MVVRVSFRAHDSRANLTTLEQLEEASCFARVAFAHEVPEFPASRPTEAEREAELDRIPKRMQDRIRRARG